MNDDLLQLISASTETTSLDFKGPTLFDKAHQTEIAELLKDLTALANRDGGDLVIGVAPAPAGLCSSRPYG